MDQSNQKKSKAAVQEADCLSQELGAKELSRTAALRNQWNADCVKASMKKKLKAATRQTEHGKPAAMKRAQ
jgi:hypothetical protein